MDRLAWLIGSYAGVAINAPKRFPRQPKNAKKIMNNGTEMTDAEMKAAAFAMAKRWNNAYQSGNAANTI